MFRNKSEKELYEKLKGIMFEYCGEGNERLEADRGIAMLAQIGAICNAQVHINEGENEKVEKCNDLSDELNDLILDSGLVDEYGVEPTITAIFLLIVKVLNYISMRIEIESVSNAIH